MIVLDDQLLFEVLADEASDELLWAGSDGVATTFSWYYRLARAIASGGIRGALSRRFTDLSDDARARVQAHLADLSDVEVVGAKELVPVMTALAAMATVNVLTADAVATALVLDAPIAVSTRSDVLDRAAAVAGVPVRFIAQAE